MSKTVPLNKPSGRAHGRSITFLSLFTREEILALLFPLALIALYWLVVAINAH